MAGTTGRSRTEPVGSSRPGASRHHTGSTGRPRISQDEDLTKPSIAHRTTFTPPERIRNFCIIAHIDHGKSTLADRMLQLTGVVDDRSMRAQYLDRMDIERERGITIKSQNVRLPWKVEADPATADATAVALEGDYVLHLIDTPGHVDFTYEVSRSLAACEGAILLVDAAQGIEAQTLANLYLAMENDLAIIPVLNKIDLPAAQPDKYAAELAHIIGGSPDDVLRVSGKTGEGVAELLDRVVRDVPPPVGDPDAPARAMIFDSVYDIYRGVITYIRVVDGKITPRERIQMMSSKATHELLEVGVISPEPVPTKGLGVGEVGYLITGVKDVRQSRVGDTITSAAKPATESLGGYRDPKPMVYSGLFPIDGSDYPLLRDALDKLRLNDAALTYEPENSTALGFGYRCGYLGLLHLEITRDRLEREFGLDLISTAPTVVYEVTMEDRSTHTVTNPSDWPGGKIAEVREPVVKVTIIAPSEYVGTIMELCQSRRGQLGGMDYLSESRVELRYTMPLAEIIFDFFDSLKSRTRGYASLDYEEAGTQLADLVKVDILLQGEAVDAFSAIVHRDSAYAYGVAMTAKLRELIPRQQFEVPIQAAVGSRIIARENIRAMRKDVLAKCYGGDITRKRKLLEKQKEGKKRMKMVGRVEVPQEAFIAALSADAPSSKDPAKK
ncbi:translation elongation factor 4 [Nakamurella aerolata]|uniref:Elongation factor 4 n=1 Tax=Nakamurella aerolata TaxID=1656892 RepID=A0A849ABK0_9ACTN|nr:elongation factor 4 [Nakamurella aerolata]